MNFSDLTFDKEQIIAGLKLWVETESPSLDAGAVNRLMDLAGYDLASLGAQVQRVPGRLGFADTLCATLNPNQDSRPGILICCHADTVHPVGTLASVPYRREGNKLWGAGLLGMKAGMYVCLEALKLIVRQGWGRGLPVIFLIVPDKQFACVSSRELIETSARRCKFVLVPEAAGGDGSLCCGGNGQVRFKLDVKVDTVEELKHLSGVNSAIGEMARHVISIEEMSTDKCSFTVGAIESGKWVNFAEKCVAEVISEAGTEDDLRAGTNKIMALNSPNPDLGLHINRGTTMPVWQANVASLELFDCAKQIGDQLNLDLNSTVGRGGSLANITAAMGVATLGGLGARGAGLRTPAERIEIDSLAERGKLMAGLLTTLS